ncbi:MAG: DEAD/DEAH box helicase [Phycisphaerales bacterium]|nr:DEAD/DEAH box helicase [Planctomycetota bacterium]MCH8509391.1 DEAD/DEAH box helicase [Phycisphaerales bacterium]
MQPLYSDSTPAPKAAKAVAADTTFAKLKLAEPILKALDEAGYRTPTPVQAMAITPAMSGHDVLAVAQTGTGKTAAFALPIIHRLLKDGPAPRPEAHHEDRDQRGHRGRRGRVGPAFLPRVLILSPTRELATQICESFNDYTRHCKLRHTAIYGGVSQFRQEKALERGVDVIVATPGRLMDLMEQGVVDLSAVRTLVLDEADRMLDMGFINPIRHIAAALPEPRQTMLFSATMPPAIAKLAASLLKHPTRVEVPQEEKNTPKIEQSVHLIETGDKQGLLERMIGASDIQRAVVFTKTKHGADRVARRLEIAGIDAVAIHGNKNQNQRNKALDAFKRGRFRVLVATDVAARGLDVDGVSHVFNFDLPLEPEAYVHRIGRTGRAGATGIAVAFCTPEERGLLRAIERQIGAKVPSVGEHRHAPRSEGQPRPGSGKHAPRNGRPRKPGAPGGPRRGGPARPEAGYAPRSRTKANRPGSGVQRPATDRA